MEMEKKLYDACLKGDVKMLEALMREDELALARISLSSCFNQTPLHLACMLGHYDLAKSLISYKPDFASRLDSQGRSPIHLASANGYASIVELLLQVDRTVCGVCDEDGRTPLHLAVMNGHHECVSQLIKISYDCGREWKILHLCVMYNRLNVLILILESNQINIVQDLSNIKDDKGNTILHFAAELRRMQMIKYLLKNRSQTLDVNALNGNGLTALDIIEQMPRDAQTVEIKELLLSAGAFNLRAKEIKPATTTTMLQAALPKHDNDSKRVKKKKGIFGKTLEKSDESLLLAASVIAAMAYQAAISPPGGIASVEDANAPYPPADQTYELSISDSLLAYFNKNMSDRFWIFNTISFLAALSVIFLYASGGSPKRRFFIWIVRLSMWITLTAMTFAYVIAVVATSPFRNSYSYDELIESPTWRALVYGILAWGALLILSTLVIVCLFLSYIVRTIVRMIKRLFRNKDTSRDTFRTPNANIV